MQHLYHSRKKKKAIDTTTHASKSGLVYRILDVGNNRVESDILLWKSEMEFKKNNRVFNFLRSLAWIAPGEELFISS